MISIDLSNRMTVPGGHASTIVSRAADRSTSTLSASQVQSVRCVPDVGSAEDGTGSRVGVVISGGVGKVG